MTTLTSGVEGGRWALPWPQFNLRNFVRQLTGTHLICLANGFLFLQNQSNGERSCDNAGAVQGGRPGSWVAGWLGGLAVGRPAGQPAGRAILTWETAEGPLDNLRPWIQLATCFPSADSSALRRETFAARGPCGLLHRRASGGRALATRVTVGWPGGWVAQWPGGSMAARPWPCRQLPALLAGRAATPPVGACRRSSVGKESISQRGHRRHHKAYVQSSGTRCPLKRRNP